MDYEVQLETYSGPLDLLLHLIQKQEIDIHDIPIALLTEQFIGYLNAMEELSLEIASEFLLMAATLLAIKSRMLLPRKSKLSEEQEAEDVDPREELVRQLLEYQRCKWAAEELKSREHLQSLVYTRAPLELAPYHPTEPPVLEGVSLWAMVDAFRKLLLRIPKEERIAEIKGHVISVEERMDEIIARLERWPKSSLYELMRQYARTRAELVSTFLAILELVKIGSIRCVQNAPFSDIEVVLEEANV